MTSATIFSDLLQINLIASSNTVLGSNKEQIFRNFISISYFSHRRHRFDFYNFNSSIPIIKKSTFNLLDYSDWIQQELHLCMITQIDDFIYQLKIAGFFRRVINWTATNWTDVIWERKNWYFKNYRQATGTTWSYT